LSMLRVAAACLCALALAVPALGWGSDGHEAIAAIASNLIKSSTSSKVSSILSGAAMSSVATWADEVRDEAEWSWSAPDHFLNTPDGLCSYSYNRDCHNNEGQQGYCVVGAINNYTNILEQSAPSANPAINLLRGMQLFRDDGLELVALKFLIHFMGDIHQPLHCGFTSDRGGNEISVTFDGKATNLHAVWDNNLVWAAESLATGSGYDWAGFATNLTQRIQTGDFASQADQWRKCPDGSALCPDTWATESVTDACKYAYAGVKSGDTISQQYIETALPVVDTKIAQAGVRLANLLDSIFG